MGFSMNLYVKAETIKTRIIAAKFIILLSAKFIFLVNTNIG